MKYILITIWSIFLLYSCEENAHIQPKPHPVVRTLEVTEFFNSGATFSAKIEDGGMEEIIEHGFILGKIIEEKFREDRVFKVADSLQNDTFQYSIETDILYGRHYGLKAYVKTDNYTSVGNLVTFYGKR